ncbi:MAG: alpha-amylase [Treponema sp.]|nr:alpha-amylase [Treponema sp.]
MEFHINRDVRDEYNLEKSLFSLTGNVILADIRQVRELTARFNAKAPPGQPEKFIKASELFAMGLIDEILHYMAALYREQVQPDAFDTALARLENKFGGRRVDDLQRVFTGEFPPQRVYAGNCTADEFLAASEDGESCRALSLEETCLLSLANLNPAFRPFSFLFDDGELAGETVYTAAIEELKTHFRELPPFGPDGQNLWDLLRAPALASPDSLAGQLEYMRRHWGLLIGKFITRILAGLDVIREESKPFFGGPGPTEIITYNGLDEYERFSPDQDWMPRTVLIAKSTLVWLYQLSQAYEREITRLDEIPDEELDSLARRGFTGLWLIGLWERSGASKTIKQWTGNPEAAASAYSLYDYDIAGELGGWGSLLNLRERCFRRGIRLGSDMVPNHTGIDSRWIAEYPDRFLQLRYPPFPTYTFNGGNLSNRDGLGVYIEDHYYNRTDAAVTFKRVDFRTGDVRYIYHGNDGTSMPWNDTAQIDFLNPEAREAVIRTIVGVCKQFSIVRFDAAMTLAKRHIQRLWYPEPGRGGDIASRSEHALSGEEFNRLIPNEFWREVVDRCASEAPNTLLLAEAFWMMEGYFVRTLGMHRVYNSAFMNMLKNEENAKYRATIKNTLEFDPEILKRFVNFMNNPDEETAVAQFGKGDKYFGICTLLVTMPGLPMFGHGQIEGFEEKYGMEYRRSYRNEKPDSTLVERHEREIFPLMKKRYIFSDSSAFRLYDLFTPNGTINENVFAYSNRGADERALILYNNSFFETSGWIHRSTPPIPQEDGTVRCDTLGEALSLHKDSRYFTLLREQRSGLWYIRSSKEIAEHGLFAALRGYEAQVFVDIHETEDPPGQLPGRWARLNHELDGRGTADPDAAIKDIFLGELYYRFGELLNPEKIDALHGFFVPAAPSSGTESGKAAETALRAEYIASFTEPVSMFAGAAAFFRDGAGGQYDPWRVPETQAEAPERPAKTDAQSREEGGTVKSPAAPVSADSAEIVNMFGAFLERLIGIADYGASSGAPYLGELAAAIRERRELAVFALAYGALSLLRPVTGKEACGAWARSLSDHWQMDRKLREIFASQGINGDQARQITDIMNAVLRRTAPRRTLLPLKKEKGGPWDSAGAGPLALAVLIDNYDAEDFRRLLGVNRFEDITWYNKENFEKTLFYASFFLLLEDDAAFGGKAASLVQRAAFIARVQKLMIRAEEVSGYKFDGLLAALSPDDDTSSKKTAKKGTAKK